MTALIAWQEDRQRFEVELAAAKARNEAWSIALERTQNEFDHSTALVNSIEAQLTEHDSKRPKENETNNS